MTDEELEQAVDKAFLKICGRTYREGETAPPPVPNSLEEIIKSYPDIFGKS